MWDGLMSARAEATREERDRPGERDEVGTRFESGWRGLVVLDWREAARSMNVVWADLVGGLVFGRGLGGMGCLEGLWRDVEKVAIRGGVWRDCEAVGYINL